MTQQIELETIQNSEHEASVEKRTGEQIVSKSLEDIDVVETRVTDELGVARGSAEAVKLTDEALVGIAEHELSSPDFTVEERRDAVEDVVVESAVELAHGATPDQTPLSIFTFNKHPGEISDVVDKLNETHATLPSGHEAAPLVMEAIDALSRHSVMGESSDKVEFITSNEAKGEKELTIDAAMERARKSAEAGIERSDFQGPEVRKAIKSYYADHEVALTVVEAMANGTLTEADKKALFAPKIEGDDTPVSIFSEALKTAVSLEEKGDREQRDKVLAAILKDAYKEPCVGQQSLSQEMVHELAGRKVDTQMILDPSPWPDRARDVQYEESAILAAQEAARNETRDAGQLLFHNTVYGRDVISNGALRGREQQGDTQDKVNITTADWEGHSSLIHWSELYDPKSYKQLMQNNAGTENAMAMTFAVPIGEVIKKAPIARGLEYANVDAKPGRTVEASVIGHEGERVIGEIGAGASDTVGHAIPAIDRVFWASTDGFKEGATYDVQIGGDDIMKYDPQLKIEVPVVYSIQSDSDRIRNWGQANKLSENTPGLLDKHREDFATLSQRDFLKAHAEQFDSADSGVGYGYAERVTIEDVHLSTESPAAEWVNGGAEARLTGSENGASFDQLASKAEPYIREIQKQSMDRFAGTYVVPLRATPMKFEIANTDNRINDPYGGKLQETVRRASVS